jgi:hypothetical protein
MKRSGKKHRRERPREINMTDLGASDPNADMDEEERERQRQDIHAAGTPGGGAAAGGLAGTNVGDGDPDNADLEDALGSGIADQSEDEEDQDSVPYSGPSGGAVGGTPAGGRASGGNVHRGIDPGNTHRGDSTLGSRDT